MRSYFTSKFLIVQVGAIFGGFKLGTNKAALPLSVTVQSGVPSAAFNEAFHRRVFLIYTGQQRLAKNTLINALRRSALSPASATPINADGVTATAAGCASTVDALVANAQDGWGLLNCGAAGDQSSAEAAADDRLDELSAVLNRYLNALYLVLLFSNRRVPMV